MKLKNKLFKKFVAGIVTSVFMLSVVPQLPIQNNIATVEAAKVKLNVKKVTLSKGKTKKLILKNAVGKVKWKSSKTSIATVSKKGVVTAKKAGKATITAKCKGQKYTISHETVLRYPDLKQFIVAVLLRVEKIVPVRCVPKMY